MLLSFFCNKNVPVVAANATVREAAQLMRQKQSGYLVIILDSKGHKKPLGIITDRDIVIRGVSETDYVGDLIVEDLMSKPLYTARHDDTVYQASTVMRVNGISRLPVVDKDNCLIGIVELADILQLLNSEFENLAKLFVKQLTNEKRRRLRHVAEMYQIGA